MSNVIRFRCRAELEGERLFLSWTKEQRILAWKILRCLNEDRKAREVKP